MQPNKWVTWRDRLMARYVHRDVRLVDGREFSIWAFPRGIRPDASWSVSWAPDFVWAARGIYDHLMYRVAYRSAWVVEIRNPKTDSTLDSRTYPSRARAIMALEEAAGRLATQTFDHVGQALGD